MEAETGKSGFFSINFVWVFFKGEGGVFMKFLICGKKPPGIIVICLARLIPSKTSFLHLQYMNKQQQQTLYWFDFPVQNSGNYNWHLGLNQADQISTKFPNDVLNQIKRPSYRFNSRSLGLKVNFQRLADRTGVYPPVLNSFSNPLYPTQLETLKNYYLYI